MHKLIDNCNPASGLHPQPIHSISSEQHGIFGSFHSFELFVCMY